MHGFKDRYADSLETFPDAASQLSQRLLLCEVACRTYTEKPWVIAVVDIDKAFLQGPARTELPEHTGEDLRMINFTLPEGSEAVLQQLEASEGFDADLEVLECILAGTGTNEAPRLSSHKPRGVAQNVIGCRPSLNDPELEILKHNYKAIDCSYH